MEAISELNGSASAAGELESLELFCIDYLYTRFQYNTLKFYTSRSSRPPTMREDGILLLWAQGVRFHVLYHYDHSFPPCDV